MHPPHFTVLTPPHTFQGIDPHLQISGATPGRMALAEVWVGLPRKLYTEHCYGDRKHFD